MRSGEFVHMGNVRQQEAVRAMQFLGLSEDDLVFLGYPDFGTFNIFSQYWQVKKPFRDRLTRISSVPYKNAPSYGAVYCGESILSDLKKQILDYQPDKIFVSHPADVNVDHKSLYLFLQVALSDLRYGTQGISLSALRGLALPRITIPRWNCTPPGTADSQSVGKPGFGVR